MGDNVGSQACPANSGLSHQGRAAKAAPGQRASGNPQLPDLSSQALGCAGLPGSEGLIHPKGCLRASPQLPPAHEGHRRTAGHREHAAAGKRPTALRRGGTGTRAAGPRLTPAWPAPLPGRCSAGAPAATGRSHLAVHRHIIYLL